MTSTSSDAPGFGARLLRAFVRLVVTALVLGLAGVTVFLLSQMNARTYTVEVVDGKLAVMKGRMMPTGTELFTPSDPMMLDTYAPLTLEGTSPMGVVGLKFGDRDELDRALFSVIEPLAKPRVASEEPTQLDRGLYFLRRAERLQGLSAEQKNALNALQAEASFYLARSRLIDAQKAVEEAMVQLRVAAQTPNRNARAANQMITAVEPEAKALAESLRKAAYTLSGPAAPPPAASAPGAAPVATPPAAGTPAVAPEAAPAAGAPPAP
jgi:hypothetical protein